MGFSTVATSAQAIGNVAGTLISSQSQKQSAGMLDRLAAQQEEEGRQRAQAMIDIAMSNATRASRNAQSELARAQMDAASSNLVSSGSIAVRERDLATRLQDDINNQTTLQLQQADQVQRQSQMDAYSTRTQASQARQSATSTLISGVGTLFGNLNSMTNAYEKDTR